jgi:hypothetical protein
VKNRLRRFVELWIDLFTRGDATAGEHGVLQLLFGVGK